MSAPRRGAEHDVPAPPDRLSAETAHGHFLVRPVDVDRDLALVTDWMRQPHVVRFWQQDWPAERLRADLTAHQAGGASRPCLGLLAGVPVSYWEIYRPALDPVGACYPSDATDLGIHVLIGEVTRTGSGLGTALIGAVCAGLFDADPRCARIVAEPDVGNVASVRAFARAGFERMATIEVAGKTAALMMTGRQ